MKKGEIWEDASIRIYISLASFLQRHRLAKFNQLPKAIIPAEWSFLELQI
jgi:hypothetical protein